MARLWGAGVVALALVGCGGGAALEARQLGSLSVLQATKPLDRNQVKAAEIEPASDSSGVRTLLRFWLTLQRAEYEAAASYFDLELRNSFGVANLTVALRDLAALWDFTKPKIVVAATARHQARVYFNVRALGGAIGSVEVQFRRQGGSWKISFFSLLSATPA